MRARNVLTLVLSLYFQRFFPVTKTWGDDCTHHPPPHLKSRGCIHIPHRYLRSWIPGKEPYDKKIEWVSYVHICRSIHESMYVSENVFVWNLHFRPVQPSTQGTGVIFLEGRVEVNFNGQWGTVWWRLLGQCGCNSGLQAVGVHWISHGQCRGVWRGERTYLLDNVQCSSSSVSLDTCSHSGFGDHNCDHSKDAGVVCSLRKT